MRRPALEPGAWNIHILTLRSWCRLILVVTARLHQKALLQTVKNFVYLLPLFIQLYGV